MRMATQGSSDQASDHDSAIKSLNDSSKRATGRRFSSVSRFPLAKSGNDGILQAEESLRSIMFLSFWGPNCRKKIKFQRRRRKKKKKKRTRMG
ncbi:hypothetical protein Nepgr_032160 [Nepenthes gracilis]|uniref:Uncharacterized protein n=1 Tax=Nepenthes gracilis TaxID=150966 RepID=A0AAD3TKB3_NEPGR|nr:hypothetical protein Nepgr_032160 [Nepenthes gracilis]